MRRTLGPRSMTGADLQWWHFAIALAIMLVFVAVFAWQSEIGRAHV